MNRKQTIFIGLFCLLWAVLILFDVFAFLRGAPGWYWVHQLIPDGKRLLPLVLTAAIYITITYFGLKGKKKWLIVLTSSLGVIFFTLAALYVREPNPIKELYARNIDSVATGWLLFSSLVDDYGGMVQVLSHWMDFVQEYRALSPHLRVSPPGLVAAFYAIQQGLELLPRFSRYLAEPLRYWLCDNSWVLGLTDAELASAWLGILSPLWGALCAPFIYLSGRAMGEERAGLKAAAWWPLIPSLLLFSPYPTAFFTLFTVIMMVFLVKGLKDDKPIFMVLSGFVLSLFTFIALSSLPLVFFAGASTLLTFFFVKKKNGANGFWPFKMGIWFGLGLISIWAIYTLVSGLTFVDLLRFMIVNQSRFIYPYWQWLWMHLYDYMMFLGLPIAFLTVLASIRAARKIKARQPPSYSEIFGFAMIASILVLDLMHVARGETGRIWLIFMPPLILMAAGGEELTGRNHAWISLLQIFCLVVLASTFVTISSIYASPAEHPPEVREARAAAASAYVFTDSLELSGFSGLVEQDSEQPYLALWLDWTVLDRYDHPVFISLTLVNATGAAGENVFRSPFSDEYPVTCWQGNIRQYEEIPLPQSSENGEWWVSLSLWDVTAHEPLSIVLPDGSTDTQVGIGPFFPAE